MTPSANRTKQILWWGGIACLALGVAFAAAAVASALREHHAKRTLEEDIAELRAKGAIVENYYPMMKKSVATSSPKYALYSSIAAGVLIVAGGSIMIVARRGPSSADPSTRGDLRT